MDYENGYGYKNYKNFHVRYACIFGKIAIGEKALLSFATILPKLIVQSTICIMTYEAVTVDEYCALLPQERRAPFSRLRACIQENLPVGFEEAMSYNLPSWVVPLRIYPAGYHCRPNEPLPFLSIASQKHFIGYYHMGLYSMPELLDWFLSEWAKSFSVKPDMGKSCIRLKKIDAIPFDLLGELASRVTVQEWIAFYENNWKK